MANLWKHPNSTFWTICYADEAGKQVKRSTSRTGWVHLVTAAKCLRVGRRAETGDWIDSGHLSSLPAGMKSRNQPSILSPTPPPPVFGSQDITRRKFLASAGATAMGLAFIKPALVGAAEANSKIDIGVVGCGGRGAWIAELFAKNGNYNVVALADYFQDRVDAAGNKLNVPAAKRFTGLSGYRRLLEQKLDAVAIETPPYFHPEQAAAAVDAGKHVYLAKPISVDVPGCNSVAESGRKATQKRVAFQVDFQTRAMPAYQEVVARIHKGGIGKLGTECSR